MGGTAVWDGVFLYVDRIGDPVWREVCLIYRKNILPTRVPPSRGSDDMSRTSKDSEVLNLAWCEPIIHGVLLTKEMAMPLDLSPEIAEI